MLFKHKHLLEELRRTGRQATGEILDLTTIGEAASLRAGWSSDTDLTTTWFDVRMKLRVVPQDHVEAPFEATVLTRIHTLKTQGSHVPVWYDPNDHSKVVVDYEADVQEKIALSARLDISTHRHDQQLGLAWTPVGGILVPIEVMVAKGKGHVKAVGALGGQLQATAQAAAGCVRDHVAGIAPGSAIGPDWFALHDVQVGLAWGETRHGGAPLAGVEAAGLAIAAALASLLTGKMVRNDVVMTGAIAPSGELLAVDDIKGKVHTAKDGSTRVFIAPEGNRHELHKIANNERSYLDITFAPTVPVALQTALTRHSAKGYQPPG